jgi:hypothetical protein
MLHYNPRHISSSTMLIFRRSNCIIISSGIVTLCKQLYSMPDESRLQSSLLSSGIVYCTALYCRAVCSHPAYCIYRTVLQSSLLSSGILYCTVLYCTAEQSALIRHIALYCTVLQSSLLSSGILHCTVLYCRAVCSHPAYCTAVYRE